MSAAGETPAVDAATDAQALAERVVATMFARDRASQHLGLRILNVGPGSACVTMTVAPHMLNGHSSCHGGFIFTLADSAFAFACNSRNHVTVASGCSIEFVAAVREGDLLTARAQEQSLGGRTGVYDITVTNQDERLVALFRGKSYRISGHVVD